MCRKALEETEHERDVALVERDQAEHQRDQALDRLEHRANLTRPDWMSETGKAFRERFAHRPEVNTLTPLGFFEAGAEWAAEHEHTAAATS